MIDTDVLENTPRGTSGEKTPLVRILRNFQLRKRTPFHTLRVTFGHYGVTFHIVTSDQKARLGRILRNSRLCMRTPKGTPKGSRDLRSLPVAMVLYYCTAFCTTIIVTKKRWKSRACAENTSDYLRKYGFVRPHILLTYLITSGRRCAVAMQTFGILRILSSFKISCGDIIFHTFLYLNVTSPFLYFANFFSS